MVFRKRRFNNKRTNIRRIVKKELAKSVEVKRIQTTENTVTLTQNGNVQQLWVDLPADGVGRDQRIGNEVYSLSHKLSLVVQSGGAGPNVFRYMLIRLRNPYDGNLLDLFERTSYVQFGAIYANLEYGIVQKVYMDKTLTMNPGYVGGTVVKFRKHYFPMKEKIEWNNSTALSQNNLYLVCVGSPSSGTSDPMSLTTLIESRYTDA